jgi:ribosome recycling factor
VIDETLLEAMEKMDKAVEHTQSQFSTVRTGRATPSLVERITVEYYGTQVPLQQIASISVPEARQLLIKPHDRSTLESSRRRSATATSVWRPTTTASRSACRCRS